MKSKRVLLIVSTAIIFFLGSFLGKSFILSQNTIKEHELSVRKVKNKWKVVDSQDSTKTKVIAKKNEKIVWTAEGSEVYFQFLDEKLFGDYTKKLKAGQKLKLTIGNKAKSGPNRYAVFCLADSTFATGDSPPEIIIE
jgi:hypothetical protein